MKTYLRLIGYVKPHLSILIAAVLCMGISSLFGGVSLGMIIPLVDIVFMNGNISIPHQSHLPPYIIDFIERINSLSKHTLLDYIVIGIMVVFLLKEIFIFLQTYLMSVLSQRTMRDMRNSIYEKLIKLSLDFFSKAKTGSLVSRITYDTSVIQNSMSEGLTDLLYQPFQVLVYVCIVFSVMVYFNISWKFLFIILVIIPGMTYPVVRIGKRLKKISTKTQETMADISNILFETISGIRVVKAFSMQNYEYGRFKRLSQRFYKIIMESVKRMECMGPLTEFVGLSCAVLILWIGGKEVIKQNLSAGAFITFLAALLSMLKPFKRLSRIHGINQQALSAAVRIFELIDTEIAVKERQGAVDFPPIKNEITFENIYFHYEKDRMVLERINFSVKKCEIVALVGKTGVGKTTIVNLIPRFYDPVEGKVLFDGRDIKDATLKSLRDQIGIVTQEAILFNDTIKANIAYGHQEFDEMKIIEAAKIANAHDFIVRLPNKYDTIIGERGFSLSGGEKQRLTIARAVFKNPPILVLDEATSQLDSESELLIQGAIDRLMSGRTVFVIAHRLSTIKKADRIIVIENGQIKDIGTHGELTERSPFYNRLFKLQFQ